MASSHVPTTTITNLTRLELEALKRADAATLGRGLTKGDDGTIVGGVGVGTVLAEPFRSGPSVHLNDIYALTPPSAPGGGLGTTTQTSSIPSETVQWFGPSYIFDGTAGEATGTATFADASVGIDFNAAGVVAGDYVLIKPNTTSGVNGYAVAQVASTPSAGATSLSLNNIIRASGAAVLAVDSETYSYVIVRKTAARLFAMPGSGTAGAEQAFLFVLPASTLHTIANPTLAQIEADRVKNIVPPEYNSTAVDRADSLFAANKTALDKLGYRVVFYPDNGAGAPDFSKPILTATPRINTTLGTGEQRMTIDYRAGIVRLSCAPNGGGDINPASALSPLGRVNLWAMFWSFDQSITEGSARSLFTQRSDEATARTPARIRFDLTRKSWLLGSANADNEFYVRALSSDEDSTVSTEFGTVEASLRKRYFRYERGTNTWRMRATGDVFDADLFSEVELGGRTHLSVGDGSAPGLSPGDYNPTQHLDTSTTAIGFRRMEEPLRAALTKTVDGSYTTVHLRKGRYYNSEDTISVPPGVIIEGEGPGTRIMARARGTSLQHHPIFSVGPNTPWGVWDASYTPTTGGVTPTQFVWAFNQKLEGYDVVWNPTRRVWGVVQADCTLNAIWFNEVKTDGTTVLPGLGIDIKNDARLLYSTAQPGSSHHTAAHYPRIAYHEGQDEYAVVWVEKDPALNGPQCKIQIVETASNNPVSFTTRFTTLAQAKLTGSGNFNDHPSVAVDNSNPDPGYAVAVSYWSFGPVLTPTEMWTSVYNSSTLANVTVASSSLTIKHVVSSTDVVEDGQGGFLWAWSERNHPIYTGTNGDVTIGVLTDPTFTGVTTFTAAGIEKGDRFLYLGGTGLAAGGLSDGIVTAVTATTIDALMDIGGGPPTDTSGNPLTWVVVPVSKLRTRRMFTGGAIGSPLNVTHYDPTSTNYRLDHREPDYVRLSHGNGSFLLVYQAFDTTGWMARSTVENFDNGFDAAYEDVAGLTLEDRTNVYRDHLSTCAIVLNSQGDAIVPGEEITAGSLEHMSRPGIITSRSLGGREPLLPNPNVPGAAEVADYHRSISARNFFHKWTTSISPSLIPDVTWTGDDWVVVSPAINEIRSTTGIFKVAGGPTYHLMDGSFYFGEDALGTASNLPQRLTVQSGDTVVFPSLSLVCTIASISSEHVVELTVVSGVAPGATTTKLEWVLVRDLDTTIAGGVPGGIKNPGFRVSADGRLIQGTSYTTFANNPDEDRYDVTPRRTETLLRKNVDGLNAPATTADYGGMNHPQFTQSRMWTDLSFRGVAVGAPKGTTSTNSTLGESPCVAIAWGETMYGFMDREVHGHSGVVNRTNFFRQTFGPYRVGFRNMSLTGGNFLSLTSTTLKVLSKEHVITRHGYPATGTGGFATDGYRNCFVSPTQVGIASVSIAEPRFNAHLLGHYTTATGRDPIAVDGPETVSVPTAVSGRYMDDVVLDQPVATNAPADIVLTDNKPSSPVVLWDGHRFVCAWTEINHIVTDPDTTRYGLICLGALPGGEDSQSAGTTLTGDVDFKNEVIEFAAVSVGNVNTAAACRSIFAADLAFSGRLYAVVWTGGQDKSTGNIGGSAIGVTIFNGTGKNSAGQTFVISTSPYRGQYQDAKITWDGHQFVAAWRQHNIISGEGQLMSLVIPEDGFGGKASLLLAASNHSGSGELFTRYLGTIESGVVVPAGFEGVLDLTGNPSVHPKPGDLVHIDYILEGGTTQKFEYTGWWVIRDYDPTNFRARLHYDTQSGAFPLPFIGYALGTHPVIGSILTMPQNHGATIQTRKDGASAKTMGAITGPIIDPQLIAPTDWGTLNPNASNFERLDSLVYNEVEDEYAALIRSTSAGVSLVTWKRGTHKTGPEKKISLGGSPRCANLAWNGHQYLLTYGTTTNDIRWVLLNARGGEEAHGFAQDGSTLFGNGVDQLPGPGYGAMDVTAEIQPRVKNVTTRWNDRLNRWVISASFLWYHERTGTSSITQIESPVMFPTTAGLSKIEFTQANRTLTTVAGPTNWVQVGMRLAGARTDGINIYYHHTCTVKIAGGGGFLTVDTDVTERDALTQAHFGVVGGADEMVIGVLLREDVVCWTLGSNSPAIKLLDADDVFFENVEFSGGTSDVEERYRWMTRPTWQNAGPMYGNPSSYTLLNHAGRSLITPARKARPVVLTNVRSTATLGQHKNDTKRLK